VFGLPNAQAQATIQLLAGNQVVTITLTATGHTFFAQALVGSY